MASLGTYDIGDMPTVTGLCTDVNGTAVTPTTIVAIVRNPAGVETTYTSPHAAITTPTTGTIKFLFPAALDTAGNWYVRLKGTAGTVVAGEGTITVRTSSFTAP